MASNGDISASTLLRYVNRFMREADMTYESICNGRLLFYIIRDHDNDGVELLLKCGADADEKVEVDDTYYCPLEVAAIFNNVPAAELLVRYGAKPNYTHLLHRACIHNHYSFAKWCIERGADVHRQSLLCTSIVNDGDFYLEEFDNEIIGAIQRKRIDEDEQVASFGDYKVTYLLVLHGANIFARIKDDDTSFQVIEMVEGNDVRARLEEVAKRVRLEKVTSFLCAKNYP